MCSRQTPLTGALVALILCAASTISASTGPSTTILYVAQSPDGTRIGPATATGEPITLQYGSTLRVFLGKDAGCIAIVEELQLEGESRVKDPLKGRPLPVVVMSGEGWHVTKPGKAILRIRLTQCGDTEGKDELHEELALEFVEDRRWWSIADTVAYAVTRDSGNTAIAGAGLFVELPFLQRLRGIVQCSFVLHLLPPTKEGEASDLGFSPIGFGLFGNRVVFGTGWNISRRGLRPGDHNRYIYVGFSVSKLLNPTPR